MKKEYAQYIDEKTINAVVPRELDLSGNHYIGDLTQYPEVLSVFDFFPVENADQNMPIPEPGYHLEERYSFSDNTITRTYIIVEDPPSDRNLSLSKRKLMNAFKTLGIWTQVKAFLEANDYWDDFDMATTLDEQEEMMQRAITALKTAFSLSDEAVENIIVNSVAE